MGPQWCAGFDSRPVPSRLTAGYVCGKSFQPLAGNDMATEYATVEVWVCVDAAGDYAVGVDEAAAAEAFDNDVGGSGGRRMVKLLVKVPLPLPIELAADVPEPDESGAGIVGAKVQ